MKLTATMMLSVNTRSKDAPLIRPTLRIRARPKRTGLWGVCF